MNINFIANKYENWKQSLKKHSYLQLTDNTELIIDNCKSVIKYEENIVELLLINNRLEIIGKDIIMGNFSTNGVIIRGKFQTIKYMEMGKERRN